MVKSKTLQKIFIFRLFLKNTTKTRFLDSELLLIPAFAQTLTARTFINPSFSAILIISHIQWAPASIDGYVQGFPETTFLKPAPLPSEKLHVERA